MAEQFLNYFLKGFQDRDFHTIHEYLLFLDPSSPIRSAISKSQSDWNPIIERICSQKARNFQNIFETAADLEDTVGSFVQTYVETAKFYHTNDYKSALEKYTDCFKDFVRLYKVLSYQFKNDWLYLAFNVICFNFKMLCLQTNDYERQKGEAKENLESALDAMSFLKQELNRLKHPETLNHKIKLLILLETFLCWIFFKVRNYKSVKEGIKNLAELIRNNNRFRISSLDPHIQVKMYYNWGKIALLTGRVPIAIRQLEQALEICPKDHISNIRLILKYLSIAKILNGQKIKEELMKKYNLGKLYEFEDKAIAKGNLERYYWEMQFQQITWVKSGLLLLFDNFRSVIYRNILKKYYKVKGSKEPTITFSEMKKILELRKKPNCSWYHEYTEAEVHAILSNLIVNGYVIGYISVNEEKAFIKVPFPKLQDVNLRIQKKIESQNENLSLEA